MSDLPRLSQAAVIGTRARPFSSKALPRAVAEALPAQQEKTEGGDAGDAADGTSVLLDAAAAAGLAPADYTVVEGAVSAV